jgi:phage terminase small subunit
MERGVVSINEGKDTLLKCPKPPIYLTDAAKKHYKIMGTYLAKRQRLKDIYLTALEVYAESAAQFEWALREIQRLNNENMGTGYIQKFSSGAKNISAEVTLKDKAEDSILKCCKIFGLDPKSDKDLKDVNPGQYDLFDELLKRKMNG